MRIAVFGAAGFIGASFVEHLQARGVQEVRPYIHTTGGGWRLARYGLDLRPVDITDRKQVRDATRGCTHVVNATWGSTDVMHAGLENLLAASLASGAGRYVHISSVSVYGDREPGTTLHEDAAPTGELTDYGRMKRKQDQRVAAFCRKGLPCVILAPPNISGAYSPFLLRVLSAVRKGSLALVDGGQLPCSLVDVENLAGAMERALFCDQAEARRIFVTDDDIPTWRDLVERVAPLAGRTLSVPTVTRGEAQAITTVPVKRASLSSTLRSVGSIIAGPSTRAILREDPLLYGGYGFLNERLPESAKRRLKTLLGPGPEPARQTRAETTDAELLKVQLRAVRHSCEAAKSVLGYQPALSFAESMDAFLLWYRVTHGSEGDSWPALVQL